MLKTKIVATLGPAVDSLESLKAIITAGVNVARMNFSHGNHEEHKQRVDLFRQACSELNVSLPVLLDTKGPEIRTGEFNGKVLLKTGSKFTIVLEDIIGNEKTCSVSYKDLHKDVSIGDSILFDDGLVKLVVEKIEGTTIHCEVCNDGLVSTKKSVNVPGVSINLPPLTEQDIADLKFAVDNDFDFVAMSFVRKASDVVHAREILASHGGGNIQIIAKIENQEGVDNANDIIRVSDGIMVARGDLGVEIPFETVPTVQRALIKKCYKRGKSVITATQMLDSMIRNPRPTRAEVSDIATAIFEGTSAIMLSGETAMGKYPVESVQTMADIASGIEPTLGYWKKFQRWQPDSLPLSVTDSISNATCTTAMNLEASAIVTITTSGKTARMISRFHPECPIIAITHTPKVFRQLHLVWGVKPMMSQMQNTTDELFHDGMNKALESTLVKDGEMVVITAGIPVGTSGTTNLLKAQVVGDIQAHGRGFGKGVVSGNLCVSSSIEDALKNFKDDDILVVPYTIPKLLPIIRKAKAIIVEENDIKGHACVTAMALEIPIIIGVDNASNLLKTGASAVIDIKKGTIQYGSF